MTRVPDSARTSWPPVSVVMPVLNEERHLRSAVTQVLAQDYPGDLEVVIALAPSDDRTREIAAEIVESDARVRLVDNPAGKTPSGLNIAVRESSHDIIVRVDGHGILSPGYIRRAVEVLDETGADNVGGVQAAEGETAFEQAAAFAYRSPLGLGGGRFHVGGVPGPADSVYLGVFRRATLDKLGGFDEAFERAQDWELNLRIRQAGGLVWFAPDLSVTYRPRASLKALARQFYLTGRWRRLVARLHRTVGVRYLAAPAACVGCAAGLLLGVIGLVAGTPWLMVGFVVPGAYIVGVLVGSAVLGRALPPRAWLWLPLVVATMHMTWGLGFLLSPRSLAGRRT